MFRWMQRNKDPQQQQQGPLRQSVQSGQSEPQRQSGQSAQSQLPQQQQMQQPQQQPSTQPGSTVAQSPAASAQAQPGFFGRLFGRKQQQQQAVNAPHDPNAPQQQQQQHGTAPVVEAPSAARCCPSKPLPPEQLDKLMQAPVAPSRYKCLQTAGAAGQPGGSMPWNPFNPAQDKPPTGITSSPQIGPLPETLVHGPFMRFGGYDPTSSAYYVSVLVVAHQSKGTKPPTLKFRDINVPRSDTGVLAQHLDHYRGYNFWRFDLTILCGLPERVVEYYIMHGKDHMFAHQTKYNFFVPGIAQTWRWGFYNSNAFYKPSDDAGMGGIQPLWRDAVFCHEQKPLHVMVGGGDQLCCDEVWNLPSLVQWLHIPDKYERINFPFTQEMADQVEWFYFNAYLKHWSQPIFADAMAVVPQAMVWDEHEVFDGWGSYPVELQFCPVFQGIFYMARKFYCLFQQHSTPHRIQEQNLVFGEFGWHWIGCLGASVALVMMDTCTERSRQAIVRPGSWAMLQQRLAALPSTVRHVIMVSPVPMVYPQLDVINASLEFMPGRGRLTHSVVAMTQKSGLASLLYSSLGETEVLDDLLDFWSARVHAMEKEAVLHMLQDMALARGFRFSFMSGHARVAAVGRVLSAPQVATRTDHRFMPQIIAPPIGNRPAPEGVVKALTAAVKPQMVDKSSKEMFVKLFTGNRPFRGNRGWCLVEERPFVYGAPVNDGSLTFQLRMERPYSIGERPETFDVVVPPLQVPLNKLALNKLQPFELPALPPLAMPQALQQQAQGPGYSAAGQWMGPGALADPAMQGMQAMQLQQPALTPMQQSHDYMQQQQQQQGGLYGVQQSVGLLKPANSQQQQQQQQQQPFDTNLPQYNQQQQLQQQLDPRLSYPSAPQMVGNVSAGGTYQPQYAGPQGLQQQGPGQGSYGAQSPPGGLPGQGPGYGAPWQGQSQPVPGSGQYPYPGLQQQQPQQQLGFSQGPGALPNQQQQPFGQQLGQQQQYGQQLGQQQPLGMAPQYPGQGQQQQLQQLFQQQQPSGLQYPGQAQQPPPFQQQQQFSGSQYPGQAQPQPPSYQQQQLSGSQYPGLQQYPGQQAVQPGGWPPAGPSQGQGRDAYGGQQQVAGQGLYGPPPPLQAPPPLQPPPGPPNLGLSQGQGQGRGTDAWWMQQADAPVPDAMRAGSGAPSTFSFAPPPSIGSPQVPYNRWQAVR